MRVLLTGARAPVTLDLVRHFYKAGHEVFIADSFRFPIARLGWGVTKGFVVRGPALDPAGYVDDLCAIVRRERIDVLVPTCEEIFFIAARREKLAALTRVSCEPLDVLRSLHDKAEFAREVEALGGAAVAPESHVIATAAQLAPWTERGDTAEWVFKPVFSRFAARTLIGPTRATVANLRPSATDPWLAQRRIRGQEYSTYGVAQAGRLRAQACYRSQYRAGLGSGIYFLAENPPGVREFVERFVARRKFTGQIGFDFIAGDDGRLYVLECNPRATSGLHLLPGDGLVDALLDAPASATASTCVPVPGAPPMLGVIMLMYALPHVLRHGGLRQLGRDMRRARDVIFAWDDPLPLLLGGLSIAEVVYIACRTRQILTRAATYDSEWNGEPL